jgi:hypothetical protein
VYAWGSGARFVSIVIGIIAFTAAAADSAYCSYALGQPHTRDALRPVAVDVGGGAFVCSVAAGAFRSAALVRGGALFVWGGEGGPGGVDRSIKKQVPHVSLKDRLVAQLAEVFDGGDAAPHHVHAALAQTLEVPRSGAWWGRPRLVTTIKGQVVAVSLGASFSAAICNQSEAACGRFSTQVPYTSAVKRRESRAQLARVLATRAALAKDSAKASQRIFAGAMKAFDMLSLASDRDRPSLMEALELLQPKPDEQRLKHAAPVLDAFLKSYDATEVVSSATSDGDSSWLGRLLSTEKVVWVCKRYRLQGTTLLEFSAADSDQVVREILLEGVLIFKNAGAKVGLPASSPCICLESLGLSPSNAKLQLKKVRLSLLFPAQFLLCSKLNCQ